MKQYIALLACIFALTACGNESATDDASTDASAASGSDSSADGNAGAENAAGNADAGSEDGGFANADEKRSYALGMDIGNSLKELPVELNVDALAEGVRDTIGGGETRLSQEELDGVMQSFVQDMESAQQEKVQEQAQSNQEKGQQFLEENKSKEGVETTDSGLQYKVVEQGEGPSPSQSDSVTVHYEGTLIDGTVFDSSRERGEPVTFPVDAVIPGWTEALQLMKQGAQYKLFIPADLAYGERGAGAQIGPNETLIFDVELLEVGDQDSADGAASDSGGSAAGDDSAATGQSGSAAGQGNGQGSDAMSASEGGAATSQNDDAMSNGESGSAAGQGNGQGSDAMSASEGGAATSQNDDAMSNGENGSAESQSGDETSSDESGS